MKRLYFFLYFGYIALICFASYERPLYWDLCPYIALTLAYENPNIEEVHDQTYRILREKLPASKYEGLKSNQYERDMESNASHFAQQLPYYSIKSFYIFLLYLIYKIGFDPIAATLLLSILSTILISFVTAIWLRRHYTHGYAYLFSALLLTGIGLINITRESSPDALLCAILISGMYLMVQKNFLLIPIILFLVSLFIRVDALFFIIAVLGSLTFLSSPKRISKFMFFLLTSLLVILSIGLEQYFHYYGWKIHAYHSFVQFIPNPAEISVSFGIKEYLSALLLALLQIPPDALFSIVFILSIVGIQYNRIKGEKLSQYSAYSVLILVSIIAHVVVYPSSAIRYFSAQYLLLGVFFFINISALFEVYKEIHFLRPYIFKKKSQEKS